MAAQCVSASASGRSSLQLVPLLSHTILCTTFPIHQLTPEWHALLCGTTQRDFSLTHSPRINTSLFLTMPHSTQAINSRGWLTPWIHNLFTFLLHSPWIQPPAPHRVSFLRGQVKPLSNKYWGLGSNFDSVIGPIFIGIKTREPLCNYFRHSLIHNTQ